MQHCTGYSYTSGLEKTLCKWDLYVPLVTKGLNKKKYFLSLIFKLLNKIKGKPINNIDFFLSTIISVRGVNWDSSPRSSKNRNDASAMTPTEVPLPAQVQCCRCLKLSYHPRQCILSSSVALMMQLHRLQVFY